MTKFTGIWLDSKKAVIASLSDGKDKIKTIESGIKTRERVSGEGKKFGRFAKQFLSFEKSKQRKIGRQEKVFFKKITESIASSEALVLLGPASTKTRLKKELELNKSLKIELRGVHDSESMTDNQIVAWVKDYFKKDLE